MLSNFLAEVIEPKRGIISPRLMSRALRISLSELSKAVHVHRNTLTSKPESERVQARLGQIAKIVTVAAELTGDPGRAVVWFRHQPLAAFDNKTPEELVREGHAEAVLAHLNTLADGVYA